MKIILLILTLIIPLALSAQTLLIKVDIIDDEERDGPFGGQLAGTGKAEFNLKVTPSAKAIDFIFPVNEGKYSGRKTITINTQIRKETLGNKSITLEMLDRDKAETKQQRAIRDALKSGTPIIVYSGSVYALSQGVPVTTEMIDSADALMKGGVEYITKNPDKSLFDSYGTKTVSTRNIISNDPVDSIPISLHRKNRRVADIYLYYVDEE